MPKLSTYHSAPSVTCASALSRHLRHSARVVALFLLTVVLLAPGDLSAAKNGSASDVAPQTKTVKVSWQRDGETTRFYVENRELGEVTMTFEVKTKNLKCNVAFPYTATFPPGEVSEAFELEPIDRTVKWEYSYTNYFKLGSNCAKHDDDYIYDLPYAPGYKFKVTQGYNGKFSHKGANQYATDWQMPEGTLVLAARGGLVVRVKDDSNKGGASMDFDRYNNYVLIRHDDGTLAHYCHLKKDSALVKPGQKVAASDAIARSGNTGFSSGPHLHFCVFKTRDGRRRISLPVKFKTSAEPATVLLGGRFYRAPESETRTAQASGSTGQTFGGTAQ